MQKNKIYKDSKELPLFNYERIKETGDFFYMVKGYDQTEEITGINKEELEGLFNEIIREFAVSLNDRSLDIINNAKAQKSYLEIARLEALYNIVVLKIHANHLRIRMGVDIDNYNIYELLKTIKIPKADNLQEQAEIISQRIAKHQNDLSVALEKIKQGEANKDQRPQDINETITNVELILERTIDLEKTTLYRFGIMQKQALKKIEQISQINQKYK